jgi:hypothetical protein
MSNFPSFTHDCRKIHWHLRHPISLTKSTRKYIANVNVFFYNNRSKLEEFGLRVKVK